MHKLAVATCLFVSSWISVASGSDLTQIERRIHQEPNYESGSAKYCLLVFGAEAKQRVWMAVDGNTIYLDRNGNGKLTDDAKTVVGSYAGWVYLGDIINSEGVYSKLRIYLPSANGTFKLSVTTPRHGGQTVGSLIRPTLADKPDDAPIIHLGGPMTLAQYGPVQEIPRNQDGVSYRVTSLKLMIGTPGIGKGTFAAYHCNCRRKQGNDSTLVGEFSFPNLVEGGAQIERRVTYKQRG